MPFPLNANELLRAAHGATHLFLPVEDMRTASCDHGTGGVSGSNGRRTTRLQSDPEQQEAPEESKQPRMNIDVSQWLVVKFVTSTLLLCRLTKDLRAFWPSAPRSYK